MNEPEIVLLHNRPVLPKDHPDAGSEYDVLDTVAQVKNLFDEAGQKIRVLGVVEPHELIEDVRQHKPNVVLNLFEGLANLTETEIAAAAVLEWLQVPFTGSTSLAIALGRDKIRSKYMLQGAGIPTPDFAVAYQGSIGEWTHGWPAIVKPACQDSSVGIDQDSVVTNQHALCNRVQYILAQYGPPVLIEKFIAGRELHANLLEMQRTSSPVRELVSVPLAEVCFRGEYYRDRWPLYSYTAKWDENSQDSLYAPVNAPVFVEPHLWTQIEKHSRAAFHLFGLRDYARIDWRITPEGEPMVLEINPNPFLLSSTLTTGLSTMGFRHPDWLIQMTLQAMARG